MRNPHFPSRKAGETLGVTRPAQVEHRKQMAEELNLGRPETEPGHLTRGTAICAVPFPRKCVCVCVLRVPFLTSVLRQTTDGPFHLSDISQALPWRFSRPFDHLPNERQDSCSPSTCNSRHNVWTGGPPYVSQFWGGDHVGGQ